MTLYLRRGSALMSPDGKLIFGGCDCPCPCVIVGYNDYPTQKGFELSAGGSGQEQVGYAVATIRTGIGTPRETTVTASGSSDTRTMSIQGPCGTTSARLETSADCTEYLPGVWSWSEYAGLWAKIYEASTTMSVGLGHGKTSPSSISFNCVYVGYECGYADILINNSVAFHIGGTNTGRATSCQWIAPVGTTTISASIDLGGA